MMFRHWASQSLYVSAHRHELGGTQDRVPVCGRHSRVLASYQLDAPSRYNHKILLLLCGIGSEIATC